MTLPEQTLTSRDLAGCIIPSSPLQCLPHCSVCSLGLLVGSLALHLWPPHALPYTLRSPLPAASFQSLPTVLLWISFSASIGFLKGQSLIQRKMNISYLGCTSLFPLPPQGQAFSSLPPGHCPLPLLLFTVWEEKGDHHLRYLTERYFI